MENQDAITETVQNHKHPFHQVDSQPNKPQKHRYERRKIKQFLHMADWEADMEPSQQPTV